MTSLRDTLVHCAERLASLAPHDRIGEQNTTATVIEPVPVTVGWDVRYHRAVYRE